MTHHQHHQPPPPPETTTTTTTTAAAAAAAAAEVTTKIEPGTTQAPSVCNSVLPSHKNRIVVFVSSGSEGGRLAGLDVTISFD